MFLVTCFVSCFVFCFQFPLHFTTSPQGILKSLSYKVELVGVQTYFCGMERRYESVNSFSELQVTYQIKFLDSLFVGYALWKKHLVSSAQSDKEYCGLCADKKTKITSNRWKVIANDYNNGKYSTCKKFGRFISDN